MFGYVGHGVVTSSPVILRTEFLKVKLSENSISGKIRQEFLKVETFPPLPEINTVENSISGKIGKE